MEIKMEKHQWSKIQKQYITLPGLEGHYVKKYRVCKKCGAHG